MASVKKSPLSKKSKKMNVRFEGASMEKKPKSAQSATKTTTTKSGSDKISSGNNSKKGGSSSKKGGSVSKKGPTASPSVYKATGAAVDLAQAQTIRGEHEKVMKEERQQRCYLCSVIVICIFVSLILMGVVLYDRYRPKSSQDGQKFGSVPKVGGANGTDDEEAGEAAGSDKPDSRLPKIAFKNLTEACMKLEPKGCFYHKNYYPVDCKRTICDSLIVNLKMRIGVFSWVYGNDTQEIDVEDNTPCGRGKLCLKGKCVDHPAAFAINLPEPQAGGVGMICQLDTSCVRIGKKLLVGGLAKRFTTCEKRDCKKPAFPKKMFVNEIAIRFLSCNNPYPVEMEPQCFRKFSEHLYHNRASGADTIPFVMVEFCKKCTDEVNNKSCVPVEAMTAKVVADAPITPWGIKCYGGGSKQYKMGYCAGDFNCVSLYDVSPDTYMMRPILKCEKPATNKN